MRAAVVYRFVCKVSGNDRPVSATSCRWPFHFRMRWRCTHPMAISNERILGCDHGQVRLWARGQSRRRQAHGHVAGRRIHRALPASRAADRLHAPAPLRDTRLRPQARMTRRRAGRVADARAAADRDRSRRGIPRTRQRPRSANLPALRGVGAAHGCGAITAAARVGCACAALSGRAAMRPGVNASPALSIYRPYRGVAARPAIGDLDEKPAPRIRFRLDRCRSHRPLRPCGHNRAPSHDRPNRRAIQCGLPARRIPSITA